MDFNIFRHDDHTFPTLAGIVESVEVKKEEQIIEDDGCGKGGKPKKDPEKIGVLESAILEGSDSLASMAMSAVLAWIDGGDYSYQAMAEYAAGIADLDGNDEFNDDEVELYNDILTSCADALMTLGADAGTVDTFLNGEDDDAGQQVGDMVSAAVDGESASNDEMVGAFAGGEVMEGVFEASFKKMRVVRGGKVKIVKKRLGKVVLSAAQRAGLKKARRKAFSSAARIHRAKSMKIRKQHGM